MTTRGAKQLTISFLYACLIASVVFWFLRPFFVVEPTCLDGILNQDETTVDCGGVCGACQEIIPAVNMEIKEKSLVYGGPEYSDVLIRLYNPNDTYGASDFVYSVSLKDTDGNEVANDSGTGFILPKETKYFIRIGLKTGNAAIASIDVTLDKVDWQTFSGYRERPNLPIGHKEYGPVSSGVGFSQVNGTLSNESGFDFQSLRVNIVLRDASGKALAVNKTELRTVVSGERRDIGPLLFPAYFPGEVATVEMESEADVYHSDNFIREYLPGGVFQRY